MIEAADVVADLVLSCKLGAETFYSKVPLNQVCPTMFEVFRLVQPQGPTS